MDEQRRRAREPVRGRDAAGEGLRERATSWPASAGFTTDFVGYETTDQETTVGALRSDDDGRLLVKLVESPFYATGGGQVADSRLRRVRGRRLPCARRGRLAARRRPGRRAGARARRAQAGRARPRARRPLALGTRPSATTPPPTCCTRRCAGGSARTCTRPAPTSARTSCASTSPTAGRSRRGADARSRTRSTRGCSRASRCAR